MRGLSMAHQIGAKGAAAREGLSSILEMRRSLRGRDLGGLIAALFQISFRAIIELDLKKPCRLCQGIFRLGEQSRLAVSSSLAIIRGAQQDELDQINAFRRRSNEVQAMSQIDGNFENEFSGREIQNGTGWMRSGQECPPVLGRHDTLPSDRSRGLCTSILAETDLGIPTAASASPVPLHAGSHIGQ